MRLGENLGVNQSEEVILDQIRTNIKRPLPQAQPYPIQEDANIILAAGGPSLKEELETIRRLHEEEGYPVVAFNGSFDFLLDNGITPSLFVMVDSRELNKRFVERAPEAPNCKFFLCSQVHPSVFDYLEDVGAKVFIWHPTYTEKEARSVNDWYLCQKANQNYFAVLGGSTVVLRGIWLIAMLGFRNQHIFGFDSCLSDDRKHHHAYEQKENEADYHTIKELECAGRTFYTTMWMISQAENFLDMIKYAGEGFNLEVYGDGLISWVMHNVDHPELLIKDNNNGSSTLESL